jgi:hypothetical protein
VYAALFELDDPELITDLCALGSRARVVLANGDKPHGDENQPPAISFKRLALRCMTG